MTPEFEQAVELVQVLVKGTVQSGNTALTTEILRQHVDAAFRASPTLRSSVNEEQLICYLETLYNTWIGEARTLEGKDDGHKPWLLKRKTDIEWRYWKRYKQHLRSKGWAPVTLEKLDELTDDTLGRLEDPKRDGAWDRRGLVVGYVQSGKTANYLGLVCKAVDSGYKVIVILAGLQNNLRSQTQIRLDEGLLGYDSIGHLLPGPRQGVGVGLIDPGAPGISTITNRLLRHDALRTSENCCLPN